MTIYTDGSAIPNDGTGRGGWAAILIFNKKALVLIGYEETATNNRMEAKAVLEGLRALKRPCMVTICTDSTYVQQLMAGISNGKKHFASHPDIWANISEHYHRQMAIRVDRVIGHGNKSLHFHRLCDRYSYLAASGVWKGVFWRHESTVSRLAREKTSRKL